MDLGISLVSQSSAVGDRWGLTTPLLRGYEGYGYGYDKIACIHPTIHALAHIKMGLSIESPFNMGVTLALFQQDWNTPSPKKPVRHICQYSLNGRVFLNMATEIPSFPVAFLSGIEFGYLTASLAILQLLTTVMVYIQRDLNFPDMFLSIRA